jgi:2-polyprenyl-3-methyl-5-hydroxy-6-metoxy-1,4-benzoquinol methylase
MPRDHEDRPQVLAHLRFQAEAERFRGLDLKQAFTHIYKTNLWGSDESRSGLGSATAETENLRVVIPALLRELGAKTLLDIPCGDFGWLSKADLEEVDYTGADIVPDLVARNTSQYANARTRFAHLDLTHDPLPAADVVLCRDCLVHLSFENVLRALANIRRSGSAYLLTTTFTEHETNQDIADGDWRLLNLERPPFHFPKPLAAIVEGCTEGDGAFTDKALGLWKITDLA